MRNHLVPQPAFLLHCIPSFLNFIIDNSTTCPFIDFEGSFVGNALEEVPRVFYIETSRKIGTISSVLCLFQS